MLRNLFPASFSLWFLVASLASAEPPIRPGDRIAIIGNTFADQLRIHGYLETMLLQHTRENPVSIRNLGWGGDMLSARDRPTGFPTEESTLTDHQTDVIIACFGMGESFDGEQGVERFRSQLNALIDSHSGKQYNGHSAVRLILVSPIACEDLGKRTPDRARRNRELQAYTHAMREVAADANVPFVDLFEASRYLMDEPAGPNLTRNGIHLNPYGYWAISHTFFDQLTADDRVPHQPNWIVRIDAASKSVEARGVEVIELETDGSNLRFQVSETSAPRLRPPTDQPLPPQLEFIRDTLVVENLSRGTYRLTVDDNPVATATAQAWSQGVAIDSSPAHQAAQAYRAVVNDKNLQFTYSWKALNQVHIVGERRASPSGKSLPREVIEFNRLANELDRQLSRGMELKTRSWRLSRISKPN
ncbi:SGNH/GDSL hydrolase family protein [Rhodopirellula sp. JC639]|uniref:SGNH/GDSL hydrolase family protein n=1 Tax=Stieleria mannarensis TaxID=2755585 RepID=UPI00160144CA|nr:SGNH/GDSL hydrolase family protein [Rhodopirellula sp. JC639]